MRYDNVSAGDWIQPVQRGYKIACCHCGLVHKLDFRIHKRRVQMRAFPANRETGQIRRWMRARGEGVFT